MKRRLLLVVLLLSCLVPLPMAQAGSDEWLERTTLGFEIADLERDKIDLFGAGIAVAFVYPGIPLSGIAPGSRIVSLEGRKIESRVDWEAALSDLPVGHEARIVVRSWQRHEGARSVETLEMVRLRVMTGREAARAAVRFTPDPVTGVPVARLATTTEAVDDSESPLRLQFSIGADGGVIPRLQLPRGWTPPLRSVFLTEQGRDVESWFKYEVQITPRTAGESAGLSDEGLVDVDEVTLRAIGNVLQFAVPPPHPFPHLPPTQVSLRVTDGRGAKDWAIQSKQAAAFRAVLRAYQAYGGTLQTADSETPAPVKFTRPPPRRPLDPLAPRPRFSTPRARPKL